MLNKIQLSLNEVHRRGRRKCLVVAREPLVNA